MERRVFGTRYTYYIYIIPSQLTKFFQFRMLFDNGIAMEESNSPPNDALLTSTLQENRIKNRVHVWNGSVVEWLVAFKWNIAE